MKDLHKVYLALSLLVVIPTVIADQVVIDDQIVDGSLCVGIECIDGEQFGFDTLKLKTDDPIIKFEDTSTSAGFPTNDWSMGITDNAGLGPLNFFINDVSSGNTVLLLEAGTTGGIALGAGSTLETNAISVGAEGAERRIAHVADGIDDTDAATMGQFNTFTTSINNNIAGDKAALDEELLNLQGSIDDLSTRLDAIITRLNGG
jgi:hypothetical protein